MKKIVVAILIFIIMLLHVSWQQSEKENSTSELARAFWLRGILDIQNELGKSIQSNAGIYQLQSSYRAARKSYKHVELFVEYFSPREAKYFINGPLVPKHDEESEKRIRYPQGFQRIEELLFKSSELDTAILYKEYILLNSQLSNLMNYYQDVEIKEGVLLEMCQLELFRIAAMNLNGYDATITQTNIEESLWCIEGIGYVLETFKTHDQISNLSKQTYQVLLEKIDLAKKYLKNKFDYNSFNRLQFITEYINPINQLLVQFHRECHIPYDNRKHAINLEQSFLFGKESFNTQFFSMYYEDTLNIYLQAKLGRLLFFDPILSGNNKRSCASCHDPSKAFTDGIAKSITIDEEGTTLRNAPTLWNVIYQKSFFYDGRAYQLEQQIFDVIHNQLEMNSSLQDVTDRLRKKVLYKKKFAQAFKGNIDTSITEYAVQKVLTEYEKTLISFNSRFDKYLRGNKKNLTAREVNGYNLFAGKALCGSCHFFPLFNGSVPPFYTDSEFEVIGTPADSSNKKLDDDQGRYVVTKLDEQQYAFKTPTVRNIELTAPYMHNGIYNKLEQVVEFYHRGGGAGLGFPVPNQTLPFDSLQLNKIEKEDIVLFLKSLTDTSGTKAFFSQPN